MPAKCCMETQQRAGSTGADKTIEQPAANAISAIESAAFAACSEALPPWNDIRGSGISLAPGPEFETRACVPKGYRVPTDDNLSNARRKVVKFWILPIVNRPAEFGAGNRGRRKVGAGGRPDPSRRDFGSIDPGILHPLCRSKGQGVVRNPRLAPPVPAGDKASRWSALKVHEVWGGQTIPGE